MSSRTSRNGPGILPYVIALLTLAADQASKILVVRNLGPDQAEHVASIFGGRVLIRYATNTGAAFSILPDRSLIFTMVAIVVVIVIVVFYHYMPTASWTLKASLGFQLAGALGNLVDRLRLGHVVDFIDVRVWPIFNVADAAIVAGVAFLVLHLILLSWSEQESKEIKDAGAEQ